jgi:hypothetical protein
MSTPETQKSWNWDDRVHSTKVRENERETEREGGPVSPLHEFVPISR